MEAIIAALLAPFLSSLLDIGKQAGAGAAEALGSQAGQLATRVWERLSGKVESNPVAKEAAEGVAAEPEDQDALAALRRQIGKILAEDEELRQQLSALIEHGKQAGVIADRGGVVVYGDQIATEGGVVGGIIQGNVSTGRGRGR
jgi:hypothetical protein